MNRKTTNAVQFVLVNSESVSTNISTLQINSHHRLERMNHLLSTTQQSTFRVTPRAVRYKTAEMDKTMLTHYFRRRSPSKHTSTQLPPRRHAIPNLDASTPPLGILLMNLLMRSRRSFTNEPLLVHDLIFEAFLNAGYQKRHKRNLQFADLRQILRGSFADWLSLATRRAAGSVHSNSNACFHCQRRRQ